MGWEEEDHRRDAETPSFLYTKVFAKPSPGLRFGYPGINVRVVEHRNPESVRKVMMQVRFKGIGFCEN